MGEKFRARPDGPRVSITSPNRTRGRTGLTTTEREELSQLRKENRQLRLEREILKNAAAFFAKEPATRSR